LVWVDGTRISSDQPKRGSNPVIRDPFTLKGSAWSAPRKPWGNPRDPRPVDPRLVNANGVCLIRVP